MKKVPAKIAPEKKKKSKVTDTDKFLNIVKKSKKGVTTQTLIKKTGFDAKKIANMVFRATKMGKIKNVPRFAYIPFF